jgi:benzodiazapine receptor
MTDRGWSTSLKGDPMRWLMLGVFLAACFVVAGIGGWFTSLSLPEWYDGLAKPSFNPPSWVFGPVWTILYILMGVAAWLVWKEAGWNGATAALSLFFVQLLLNLLWSALFFGLRSPEWALVEIVILWAAIVATTLLFFRHSTVAGGLMLPYLLWVTFAAVLNAAIARLN